MVTVKIAAFSNPVGFCFVAIETRAGSWGKMCVAELVVMAMKGEGPVEDGHHGSVSEGPAHFEGTLFRER
jgi:hypothetical protein